jgi:hypothetical protein
MNSQPQNKQTALENVTAGGIYPLLSIRTHRLTIASHRRCRSHSLAINQGKSKKIKVKSGSKPRSSKKVKVKR